MNELQSFNPIENTCIDYMHSVLEGVVKGMFRLWFSPDFVFTEPDDSGKKSRNAFSLRQYIDQIDDRLLKIKPPGFVPAAPRSVDLWCLWRAHEFLYFLIYYSLCVFHEIMDYDYYQHLMLLVIAMENLLKPKIKKIELQPSELLLQKTLKNFYLRIFQVFVATVLQNFHVFFLSSLEFFFDLILFTQIKKSKIKKTCVNNLFIEIKLKKRVKL